MHFYRSTGAYKSLRHWVFSIFTYNISSRFSFPRPPCCAFRGPTSSTSTNEHWRPSSPSTTARTATTFSRGTPTSSPSSTANWRRKSRGRVSCTNGTRSYDCWSETAPRSKGEKPIYLCGFDVLMKLLQVTQDISGLSPPNLSDALEKFTICTHQKVTCHFGLSSDGRQLFRHQKRCEPNKRRERRTDGGDERTVGAKVRAINRENHETILTLTSCGHSRHSCLLKSLMNVQFRCFSLYHPYNCWHFWIWMQCPVLTWGFFFAPEGKQLQKRLKMAKMWVNVRQW